MKALDADFYVFSGHKLYGPTGIGVLYGKASAEAAALSGRRRDDRRGADDAITYADPPHRFEAGTPAIVEAIGLGAAIDFDSIGRSASPRTSTTC